MAPSGTQSSATTVGTHQTPVAMAAMQFNDGYVSILGHLEPTRSPRLGTITTRTCRGAPEATGAPSYRFILLVEALTKPWIVPFGHNRRKWRALPRGSEMCPNLAKLPRIGRGAKLAILDGFGQSARSMAL